MRPPFMYGGSARRQPHVSRSIARLQLFVSTDDQLVANETKTFRNCTMRKSGV
jgi:hypothetical protein